MPRSAAPSPPPPLPEPAPAAAAKRGHRPLPRSPSPAGAAASQDAPVPYSRSEEEVRGKDKGVPRWRAGSSPGAALVERGIDGAADGIGLRREPAAVGRASRSLSGTERRRSAPCPRRQGGGRARASCSEAREPVLPEASQRRAAALRRGRLDAPGRAAAGSALPPRVPTRSVIPSRVPGTPSAGAPQPAASRGRFAPSAGAGSLLPGSTGRSTLL